MAENTDKETQEDLGMEECLRYLVFEIDHELYGVSLLDIKEVLKSRPCKPVPYMKDYFLGIINLRGKIVSIIDLRLKFKKDVREDKNGFIIIIEADNSQVGVVVDDILNVENIEPHEIDTNPHLELDFPMQFFLGVGKKGDRLINLIDLAKCLTKEDMKVLKSK